jgi:hypothetical protein
MDLSRSYVAFACARVRHAPTRATSLTKQHAINRQLKLIQIIAQRLGFEPVAQFADCSTTAGTRFLRRPTFLQAVERAKSSDAILMIEDVGWLFRHLEKEATTEDVRRLLALDVPVLEASTGLLVSETPRRVIAARVTAAQAAVRVRASAIQRGIKRPRSHSKTKAASKRAAARRRAMAVANAHLLAPLVGEIEAERSANDPLNANALATALNGRGVKSPRGGNWSYGTAARLLKLIRQSGGMKRVTVLGMVEWAVSAGIASGGPWLASGQRKLQDYVGSNSPASAQRCLS